MTTLLCGCNDSPHPQDVPSDSDKSPAVTGASSDRSEQPAVDDNLHTDKHIESLADFDISTYDGDPILHVVPNGKSFTREFVFKKLKLEPTKLTKFRTTGINAVQFLTWKVSPSYDIQCMTAINDPENHGLELDDPKRKIYGIRLTPAGD